ncbi:MAG: hypothetical protein ACK5Z5_05755 [Neisseriaceae bacterium]
MSDTQITRMQSRIQSMQNNKSYQGIRNKYLPEIKEIITKLRKVKCKELDIAHFLMGKRSLKDCLLNLDKKDNEIVSNLAKTDIIKKDIRWFGTEDYYINEDAAQGLSYILKSGDWFGSLSEEETKTREKLDYLSNIDDKNYSNTEKNTYGVVLRFNQSNKDKSQLQEKFDDLKKIIDELRKAKCCTEFQIARFLMGEISLEDCGYSDSHMVSKNRQNLKLLTKLTDTIKKKPNSWLGDAHYIDKELSRSLNYILSSGKIFGSWTEDNTKSADKLDALLYELKNDKMGQEIKSINKQISLLQQVNDYEIENIQKVIKEHIFLKNDTKFPLFLVKSSFLGYSKSIMRHSVLLYKDGDKYKILIKPNFSNNDEDNEHLRSGTYKIIKNSGIEITLDKDKNLESVNRVVTHSKIPTKNSNPKIKNEDLKNTEGDNLEKDGFKEVVFKDDIDRIRIIYVQKYLGESLNQICDTLTPGDRFKIMEQLLNKVTFGKNGTYDIKLQNVLWDGKAATFIDFTSPIATYFTQSYSNNDRGMYLRNIDSSTKCQYFSLCLMFFQLSLSDESLVYKSRKYFHWSRKKDLSEQGLKDKFKNDTECLDNPFWPILMKAYAEQYSADKSGEKEFREEMEEALRTTLK